MKYTTKQNLIIGLVTFSHNIARLKPKNSNTQKLLEYSLKIEPNPYETSEFIDYFENTNNFMLIENLIKSKSYCNFKG
jgi:hypothetical protein